MKVLHILGSGNPGGIETLLLNIIRRYEFESEVCFFHSEGIIAEEMKNEGIKTVFLNAKSGYDIRVLPKLYRYIQKNTFDVVNIHNNPLSIFCMIIIQMLNKNIRVVYTEHGGMISKGASESFKVTIFHRIIRRYIKNYIAVSNKVKDQLMQKYKVDPNKINVIYNGIEMEKFAIKSLKVNKQDEFTIGFVGRLVKEKGLDILINAFYKFSQSSTSDKIKLIIVGDGPEKEKLISLVKSYGLNNLVEFWGFRRNISEILNSLDLFIYPSTWEEAFGISVIEAMAAGVPCVVFNKGAFSEIIDNNVDGFIVNEISSNALANEITRLHNYHKNGFLDEISLNAQKKVRSKFLLEYTVENLNKYYLGLCGSL